MRSPPSDAVERCRDAIFFLRELEHSAVEPEIDYVDLDDLRELLLKPHFRVSTLYSTVFLRVRVFWLSNAPEFSRF